MIQTNDKTTIIGPAPITINEIHYDRPYTLKSTTIQKRVSSTSLPFGNVISDDGLLSSIGSGEEIIAKGGVDCPFPWKLHEMLEHVEEEDLEHVVSWMPHGLAFRVHNAKEFAEVIMPKFFGQTKYPSFQRQLNLYGFSRFNHGKDKGAYYHACFIKGNRQAVRGMVRRKVKGTRVRRAFSASEEPDLYSISCVSPVEVHSVRDSMSVPNITTKASPTIEVPSNKTEIAPVTDSLEPVQLVPAGILDYRREIQTTSPACDDDADFGELLNDISTSLGKSWSKYDFDTIASSILET